MNGSRSYCLLAVCGLAAVAITGCTSSRPRDLLAVALPDLSRTDEGVQRQARDRYATLMQRIQARATPAAELGAAYGDLGKVLQAAEYYDAAEPCYLNAERLAPSEPHWPYYLGHLYRSKGATDKAETAFRRVLEIQPGDFATMIWLGRLQLDQGRIDGAEPMFTKALAFMPRSVAALAGLGRVALAKRDYARAVTHLEAALALDPEAHSLHASLAIAYRGLGQLENAEPHARQWRNRDILFPDPWNEELDLLLESGLSYELRGVRALESHDWPAAVGFFRKGLALARQNTPLRRSLQHKLGTALYMTQDVQGAAQQFEEVVRLAPASGIDESVAKAHYSLGVLMASNGRGDDAIAHLLDAVKYQPNYVEARLALGDVFRRSGRPERALGQYEEALKINPRAAQARLGYAMALTSLRHYRQARDWLNEAVILQPDQPMLAHALARVLATVPDDRVRDGPRALALVQGLFKQDKSTELGETMAMALAEVGDYEQAAAIQRGVREAANQAGLLEAVQRMTENLRLYERHQACRTPWRNDEPIAAPGPQATLDIEALSRGGVRAP